MMTTTTVFPYFLCTFSLFLFPFASGLSFIVPESVPIGHVVGYIEGSPRLELDRKYFIVYSDQPTEKTFEVSDRSGEITTISLLDFEKQSHFEILAVPIEGGETIVCSIDIEDENDHSPTFPDEKVTLEISEFARIGAEFALPLAADHDGPNYNVQKYRIAQGNVNNVFKISSRRVSGVLYADLVVNGQLDREYRDKYELIVEAVDGGTPQKIGRLRVNIRILDANDNAPVFVKPSYSISVPSSTAIGTAVLTVRATDADVEENARLNYRLQKTRSSSLSFFSLSPSGVLSTTSHLLPGAVHDLVVVATDAGVPQLETTVFVTITVQGSSLESAPLDLIWLTGGPSASLIENITLGSIVARLSLSEKQRTSRVTLSGCTSLCLQQSDTSHIYLLLVCGLFDRETQPEYHMKLTISQDTEVLLEHPVLLTILDVNDNAPTWPQSNMHISMNRGGERGKNEISLVAMDTDQGQNGHIRYSILDSDVIDIDPDTGRLSAKKELDCSVGSELRFTVRADDIGIPPLSSDMMVTVDVLDSSNRPPQFEKPLYEVVIKEDAEKGTCLLKVKANNSICGGTSKVRYSFEEKTVDFKLFSLDSVTGTVCLESQLDFEKERSHQMRIVATDQGGLSSSCLISVVVMDVNDHAPLFRPLEYNISIREGTIPAGALLAVSATDKDSGSYGEVSYSILADNHSAFRVDSKTGEIFGKGSLEMGRFEVIVGAADGNGATAEEPARVHVSVIDRHSASPSFTESKYVIRTSEDILPGIAIGGVRAVGSGRIRYSIYSGDADHRFSIHPETGRITVARYLDAEKEDSVLLNVQADLEGGGSNHTQVVVLIDDHNDNAPQFNSDVIEITIREDQPVHEPFYVIHATDKDKKKNGLLSYSLLSSQPDCPLIVLPMTGQIQLTGKLDYETTKVYRVRVKATDSGIPPKSANCTLIIHVSDANDNAPMFDRDVVEVDIVENSPSMSLLTTLIASDADSDSNSAITYRITNGSTDIFTIETHSGRVYAKEELDRERQNQYNITVTAEDGGVPPLSSSIVVFVRVLDVNDNAPSCHSIHTLVVPEDADTNTPFGTMVITDPDLGENGTVVYRSQQSHPLFILNNNGDVHLRRRIISSDPMDYRLAVIASDQGTPKKSSVCHVAIKVIKGTSDVRIQEPIERVIRVPASCTPGCQLSKINASGVAKWQMQSSEVSSHFSISNDGWLSLLSLPSLHPPWSLTLILADRENRQKHVTVRVLPPVSKNLRDSVTLSPSLAIGSKIAMIGDTSRDASWYYTISNQSDIFEIDQSSGTVYLRSRLRDRSGENLHIYFKKHSTTDLEEEDIEMEFEVANNPVERPVFVENSSVFDVREDTPVDSIIAGVTARISESNISIYYRFSFVSDVFSIDQYSGDISLLKELDWYEASSYNLVVEAYTPSASSTQLVHLNVVDVNNHRPEIISADSITILSDSPKVVHTVVAIDRDGGQNGEVSYDIVSETEEYFSINEKSGDISMERIPNSDLTLTIQATDNGSPPLFQHQQLTVRLLATEDNKWRFFDKPEYEWKMEEDHKEGTIIGTISGSAHLQPINMPLSLILEHGQLKVRNKLESGVHQFSVLASSPSGETDWASVTVSVTPRPTSPRISSASCGAVSVQENRAILGVKRIVVGNNPNQDAKFKLQGANDLFEIDSRTGEISCSELDRETKPEYLLVVIAERKGLNDSCTVRVIVSDVNDNSPQFSADTPQLLHLNSSTKPGAVVHRLTSIDLDSGNNGRVRYELIEDPSTMLEMEAETGELKFARNVPFSKSEWMIRVRAVDTGDRPMSSDRFIRVRDERESVEKGETQTSSQPAFTRHQYLTDVDEGLDRGQNVAKVSTNARDARITFSIVEGNLDGAFEIDNDGVVRTAQELDYEIRPNYKLRIIGTGQFNGEISTRIDVKVNNLNDNPPAFPRVKNRKIAEDLPLGSYITTMTANDVDMLDVIEYSLGEGAEKESDGRFVIDKFTGVVHTRVPLDFETEKEISVKVSAWDGKHRAIGGFSITVLDVNDNAPEFPKKFYDVQIPFGSQGYDVILKVMATDRDSGDNGRVTYSIEGHDDMFTISPDGDISILSPIGLDAEYLFNVVASDHGQPRMTSSVPVRVTVSKNQQNKKKERPGFKKTEYEFRVSEGAALHTVIGNVSVSAEPLWYRIRDAEAAKWFSIDRFGRLSIRHRLDRETRQMYTFEVDVGDENSRYGANSTTRVTIRVADENDNSPQFQRSRVDVVIKDGLTNGQVVLRLSATDPDSEENGRVSYRILSGNDYGIVALAPDTGALMYNEWNDEVLVRHKNASWITVVEARDHGYPSRSSLLYVEFSVSMTSWSATAPFFVQSQYVAHVRETAPVGTVVFVARAVNRAGIQMSGLRYSMSGGDQTFSIDSQTGVVQLKSKIDFETQTSYELQVTSSDARGRAAVVALIIRVNPMDEYAPVFTKERYSFQVPIDSSLGTIIGNVRAVDADGGLHGIVRYKTDERYRLVAVDQESGEIKLQTEVNDRQNLTIEQFEVTAYSSETQISRATVYLEIGPFNHASSSSPFSTKTFKLAALATVILFAILLILLVFCVCCRRTRVKEIDNPRKQVYSVSKGQIAVLADARRMSPSYVENRRPPLPLPSNVPPKSNSMTSSASSSSGLRSTVSSREFVSTRSQLDSGIDPDTVSVNSSVTEYLVSIGVNPNPIPPKPRLRRRGDTVDSHLNELIYARMDDVIGDEGAMDVTDGRMHIHTIQPPIMPSSRIPSYQPLTDIFREITRMQEEEENGMNRRECVQIEI